MVRPHLAPWTFAWPVQLLLALKPSLQQRLQAAPARRASRLLQRRLQRLQATYPLLRDLQQRQDPQASADARAAAAPAGDTPAATGTTPAVNASPTGASATRLSRDPEPAAAPSPKPAAGAAAPPWPRLPVASSLVASPPAASAMTASATATSAAIAGPTASTHAAITATALAAATPTVPFLQRPFGVNLIGHAFEVFGVGEDIRMAARALAAAGVPTCVLEHPAANGACRTDPSLEGHLQAGPGGGPYAFNLICMTAPIQARWLLQGGLEPLRERYTIAAWPWETEDWPAAWQPLFHAVDELWPASRFTAQALQGANRRGLPLQLMPMAAEIPQPQQYTHPGARRHSRAQHGLPPEAVLVLVAFDLNSTAIRKNPAAAIEAFQRAFPPEASDPLGRAVALVLKTFPTSLQRPEFAALQRRYQADDRLHWISRTLARQELLALYGCCDVYLSLHRSEGYGRGLAEALQLGLEVVATDYGGNTDFCSGPRAHPVRWQRVPIPPGAYPRADGQHWAEPDGEQAAALLRPLVQRRLEAAAIAPPLAASSPRVAAHHPLLSSRASLVAAEVAAEGAAEVAAGAPRPASGQPAAWSLPPVGVMPAELMPAGLLTAELPPTGLSPASQAPPHERDAAALPFSFAQVGGRYRARLETLWQQRQQLAEQLTWRQDRSPLPR